MSAAEKSRFTTASPTQRKNMFKSLGYDDLAAESTKNNPVDSLCETKQDQLKRTNVFMTL